MSEESVINSINFTPDGKAVCVSYSNGFCVYSTSPITLKFKQDEPRSIRNAITLTDFPKVIYSGVEGQRNFNEKAVCVFDCTTKRPTVQIDFPEKIERIVMTRKMYAVSLPGEIRVYQFDPPGLYSQIRCANNPNAPCDIIEFRGDTLVALTGRQTGVMRVMSLESEGKINFSINAHTHCISQIKFNSDGSLIATASDQGTLVRVFNSHTGDRVAEFRRGTFTARIDCLAFGDASRFITALSSNGTLHLFELCCDEKETQRSLATWKSPSSEKPAVTFSGHMILFASANGNIRILDVDGLKEIGSEELQR